MGAPQAHAKFGSNSRSGPLHPSLDNCGGGVTLERLAPVLPPAKIWNRRLPVGFSYASRRKVYYRAHDCMVPREVLSLLNHLADGPIPPLRTPHRATPSNSLFLMYSAPCCANFPEMLNAQHRTHRLLHEPVLRRFHKSPRCARASRKERNARD
jgi:hypothetical protein